MAEPALIYHGWRGSGHDDRRRWRRHLRVRSWGLTNDTSTADIIVDYTEGVDSITAAGGAGVEVANGAGMNEAQLIDAANTSFAGGNDIYIAADANDSGNAYVYVDNDGSGTWTTGDYIIVLQGIDNDAEITAGDFT